MSFSKELKFVFIYKSKYGWTGKNTIDTQSQFTQMLWFGYGWSLSPNVMCWNLISMWDSKRVETMMHRGGSFGKGLGLKSHPYEQLLVAS
jgi:hypothetical protein